MSITRKLRTALLLITAQLLVGCDLLPAKDASIIQKPLRITSVLSFNEWLTISREMAMLDEQQAAAKLEGFGRTQDSPSLVFRYGLLNQQLNRLDGWVRARDSFRSLADDQALEPGFRELARIYQMYNQSQINWYERHRNLQKEVVATMSEREALQLKIEALTRLEEVISERKQIPTQNNGAADSRREDEALE